MTAVASRDGAPSGPVYRHYSRPALDRQYDNSAKVAGAAERIADLQTASRAAQRVLASEREISYGSQPAERLDVFHGAGAAGRRPLAVFFHGGYWQSMHKDDFSAVACGLVPANITVAVVNYALMPRARMVTLVAQCRGALKWLIGRAADLGCDPRRVFVYGHSAGAHLAATSLATIPPGADTPAGGCGISGLYDLLPVQRSFLNDVLSLTTADVRRFSPASLTPPPGCRFAAMLGEAEGPEFWRQSSELVRRWRRRGARTQLWMMPGHDHFSVMSALAVPDSDVCRSLRQLMGVFGPPLRRGAK